jgi:hypothetical protein
VLFLIFFLPSRKKGEEKNRAAQLLCLFAFSSRFLDL